MGTHPIFESDFDCLTVASIGRHKLLLPITHTQDIIRIAKLRSKNLHFEYTLNLNKGITHVSSFEIITFRLEQRQANTENRAKNHFEKSRLKLKKKFYVFYLVTDRY